MQEIWKDIKGYEGLYQVNNFGNIKNTKGLLIKQFDNHYGYLIVSLFKNKKQKSFPVHRLVAINHIENPSNYEQVNHIDGNKLNNCVDNLEWCTRSQNQIHAFQNGLNRGYVRSSNPNSKKLNQYDLNGNFIKQWDCIKDAMDELNICRSSIHRCCTGKFKQSHGFVWRYADK